MFVQFSNFRKKVVLLISFSISSFFVRTNEPTYFSRIVSLILCPKCRPGSSTCPSKRGGEKKVDLLAHIELPLRVEFLGVQSYGLWTLPAGFLDPDALFGALPAMVAAAICEYEAALDSQFAPGAAECQFQ